MYSVIEFIWLENYALIYLRRNFCEMTINDNKAIPENLVVVLNIISFKEIQLIFLILRRYRINKVRLQNLYLVLFKHIASNSGDYI